MSRETSPYVVGDFWLDQRRDGKAEGIWQIARYAEQSRSVVYRSTKQRGLEQAKAAIHAYVDQQRALTLQPVTEAELWPQIMLYWREHGKETRRPDTIAGSLRAFLGFMMQDSIGARAKVADLTPVVFTRFRQWRMKPHTYAVPWGGRDYENTSPGVSGEAVQRNLDDIRAALNHAARNARIAYAPKVPSVPTEQRSPARDVRVEIATLGAMLGYAQAGGAKDRGILRWLLLMVGTASRPEACLAFNPETQWLGDMLNMHPPAWPRTKKRNPVVPAIRPLRPILCDWRHNPSPVVKSRKRSWNTMRGALGLPDNIIPKTIRHTIATELRRRGVPGEQISGLLGHTAMHRTTEVYAKYDPAYLTDARQVLTKIFREVLAYRRAWHADHMRTTGQKGRAIVVAREGKEA